MSKDTTSIKIQLLHNHAAGDGNARKGELIDLLKAARFSSRSFKKNAGIARQINPDTDIIAVAAGDGTVRELALDMLNAKLSLRRPIALLPHGTANNIAQALGITGSDAEIIKSWHQLKRRAFDVGQYRIGKKRGCFLESFGFGIIAKLIRIFNDGKKTLASDAGDEMKLALQCLLEITENYKGRLCHMTIGDKTIKEKVLLMEVMNIPSIGPGLHLSPLSNCGDGYLEMVYLRESDKDAFCRQLKKLIQGESIARLPVQTIPMSNAAISLPAMDWHVDDRLLQAKDRGKVHIKALGHMLEFLGP